MSDYAVNKVKTIMRNKSVFCCRSCGLSHETYPSAKDCCGKQSKSYNKNQHTFEAIYNKLIGG